MSEHLAALPSQTLDELFSRDPFEMSDADLERIVDVLREQRKNWAQAEATAVAKGRATAKKTLTPDDIAKLTSSITI